MGPDGLSRKVLNTRERKMSNRKTEIKTVDQCHMEGRTVGRRWKNRRSSVGKREG
jgi:hypothetical protein